MDDEGPDLSGHPVDVLYNILKHGGASVDEESFKEARMSDEEQPEECEACQFETTKLTRVPPHGVVKEVGWFCDFCFGSLSATAAEYPESFIKDGRILQHVCLVANMLLEKIEQGKD